MSGPIRRILQPEAPVQPSGGTDTDQKVADLNSKVAKIEGWITDTAQPIMSQQDDAVSGLMSRTDLINSNQDVLAGNISRVNSNIPDTFDQRIQAFMKDNFVKASDGWFEGKDIGPKADGWIEKKDLNPKITEVLGLPDGIVPIDAGEFLGIIQRVGGRVQAIPEYQLVSPGLNTIVGPGSGGVGVKTSGVPGTMHTIPKAAEIEDRLSKILSTWYPTITSLQAGWSGFILPTLKDVEARKGEWNDAANFFKNNTGNLAMIMSGQSNLFDGRISSIVQAQLANFRAQVEAKNNLPLQYTNFLGTFFVTDAGGKAPKDFILETISFYRTNFAGGSMASFLTGAGRPTLGTVIDQYMSGDSGEGIILGKVRNWWDSQDMMDRSFGRSDEWFDKKNIGSRVQGHLDGLPEFGKLREFQGRFGLFDNGIGIMRKNRPIISNLKDRLSKMRNKLQANGNGLALNGDLLKQYQSKKSEMLGKYSWAEILGLPGYAFVGAMTAIEMFSLFDKMFMVISGGLDNVKKMIDDLRGDIDGLTADMTTMENNQKDVPLD